MSDFKWSSDTTFLSEKDNIWFSFTNSTSASACEIADSFEDAYQIIRCCNQFDGLENFDKEHYMMYINFCSSKMKNVEAWINNILHMGLAIGWLFDLAKKSINIYWDKGILDLSLDKWLIDKLRTSLERGVAVSIIMKDALQDSVLLEMKEQYGDQLILSDKYDPMVLSFMTVGEFAYLSPLEIWCIQPYVNFHNRKKTAVLNKKFQSIIN